MRSVFSVRVGGPVLRIERSDCGPTLVARDAVLLAGFESIEVDATVAVFVTVPVNAPEVENVDVIVTDWPDVIEPIVQG
jgi:hypothetical protein